VSAHVAADVSEQEDIRAVAALAVEIFVAILGDARNTSAYR
jgi:hypothetical protein